MSFVGSNILAGAAGSQGGDAGFKIDRSLRFNSADSAYLNRTPSSAGNRKTWTWSGWIKRNKLGTTQRIFAVSGGPTNDDNWFAIAFNTSNQIFLGGYSTIFRTSTAVYRDVSAWMHCVVSVDLTASTTMKVWINGVEQSLSGSSNPSNTGINNNLTHYLGVEGASAYCDLQLAEVHFIDGQALAATDFGEYDDNNVWQPKEFTGSYTSTNTSTTLTQTGWDPSTTNAGNHTLIWDGSTTNKAYGYNGNSIGTVTFSPPLTGVIKVECYTQDYNHYLNGTTIATPESVNGGWHTYYDSSTPITLNSLGNSYTNNTQTVDLAAIRINGTIIDSNTWTPPSGVGVQSSGANSFYLKFADNSSNAALGTDSSGNSNTWTVHNLVAAAAGLSTANQGFDAVTYTGTGSDQAISSLSFQPDFVWIKTRNEAENHFIVDSVRGVTKQLYANSTGQEYTNSNRFKSFDSNGFTVGSTDDTNQNNNTFVAWAWKAGGAASSNTDGSITSSVSANNTYGFSIVKWSNSSSSATIGHGLNAAPALIFTKGLGSCEWQVYHKELGNAYKLYLNGGDAQVSSSVWSTTTPTSSVFNFNDNRTQDFIAYCWSEVSGFSKFGTYTGNGSATGPVITTGFKPRFVLVKGSSYASNWNLIDTARSTSNPRSNVLRPNSSAAEFSSPTGTYGISLDVLDDGFQLKSGSSTNDINQTGATYIYAAFADKPDGSVIDSLIDSPTNYEATPNNGGNYATLNPLNVSSKLDLSNGNLRATQNGSNEYGNAMSTIGVSTGKFYCEMTLHNDRYAFGVGVDGTNLDAYLGQSSTDWVWGKTGSGNSGRHNGNSITYSYTTSAGDILGLMLDLSGSGNNGILSYSINGVNKGAMVSNIPIGPTYFITCGDYTNSGAADFSLNFGQRPFNSLPSGYKSICTTNLPDPTIADGSQYFRAITRTGGGTNQSFTTLNPGLVWQKNRGATSNHYLYDKVRGDNKYLNSAATTAEATSSGAMAFSTNGYVVNSSFDWPSNNSIIDWVWDAGTSTVSNTDGSITSSVRANPSSGFSIVKWTGNRSGSTVGHGLNAAVKFYFVKNLDQGSDWLTFHIGLGGGQGFIRLNTNGASGNASSPWNSTVPTSSVFSLGADSESNGNGDEMIAYCFAPVEGYSAFGSFSGNGTSDNVFVYTGFRPKFVLAKYSSSAGDWILLDTSRRPNGPTGGTLVANNDTAEDGWFTSGQVGFDFLSNGFKIRHNGAPMGDSGRTVIYAAFAEHPFKTARAY